MATIRPCPFELEEGGVQGGAKRISVGHVASFVLVPTFTADQIRDAEQPYLRAGVPLMMRASAALARVASAMVAWDERGGAPNVLALVGSGNNGGDALYAAADLARRGASVSVVPVGRQWHEGGMAAALGAGAQLLGADPANWDPSVIGEADVIIDGILGTGTTGRPELRGAAAKVVGAILESGRVRTHGSGDGDGEDARRTKVVAVDIPSGLHPDTGEGGTLVLPADVTVSFGGMKVGLAVARRRKAQTDRGDLVGQIVLVDIGISEELEKIVPVGAYLVEELIWAERT